MSQYVLLRCYSDDKLLFERPCEGFLSPRTLEMFVEWAFGDEPRVDAVLAYRSNGQWFATWRRNNHGRVVLTQTWQEWWNEPLSWPNDVENVAVRAYRRLKARES